MKIKIDNRDNFINIEVYGTLDNNTSNDFFLKMENVDIEHKNVVLDFSNVDYITSAGLRILLVLAKRAKDTELRIININSSIEEVFKMTGFDKLINYSLKEALSDNLGYIDYFNKRVNESKNKIICTFNDREYSWFDLDVCSQIVSNDLFKLGVKKGSHVGICAYNSTNWLIVYIALRKLGAIAVLINSQLKVNEINDICEIGGIDYLCYGSSLDNNQFSSFEINLKKLRPEIIVYDISNYIDFILRKNEYEVIKNKFREKYNCDDPSIIIFTSGSSGKPKAVIASDYNVLIPIKYFCDFIGYKNDDRSCAFLPFFHIFGLCSLIQFSVVTDTPIFIPKNNQPSSIVNTIEKYRCTIFHSVPTMMLAIVMDKNFDSKRLLSLRLSVLGGAITTEQQMKLLQKAIPNNHFANVYGMSENAIISLTKYEDTIEHMTQTVGLPPDYLDIEIREVGSNKVLERNETGEICIRSKTMIVNYYNLDIDKQPIGTDGYLRTGDLGYIDNDGYVILNGRVKELIIRGGENISPNEVCNCISKLDEIANAKVIGIPSDFYGEEVAAAIVMKDGKDFNPKIRDILSNYLAKYKIPSYFVILDKLPLLGSGKIDSIKLKNIVIEKIRNEDYK